MPSGEVVTLISKGFMDNCCLINHRHRRFVLRHRRRLPIAAGSFIHHRHYSSHEWFAIFDSFCYWLAYGCSPWVSFLSFSAIHEYWVMYVFLMSFKTQFSFQNQFYESSIMILINVKLLWPIIPFNLFNQWWTNPCAWNKYKHGETIHFRWLPSFIKKLGLSFDQTEFLWLIFNIPIYLLQRLALFM